ncbi:MAG: putative DNA modification/repair radical SAM protein [Clostridia bacterium]|nr:putative DNA modification/repair radical SAM protein [Clostridia bacterium]
MLDEKRLAILADSAKYDVSCSSSGSKRQNSVGGLGNACFGGICHSFTQDGRCVSLLKILMSNDCVYDCAYCVNRRSNPVERATATPEEICELVINFYKRNYIEGLFLSSAVIKSPDFTMELLFDAVKKLRTEYKFNGYIHLKGIPGADKLLIERAGFFVDRISFNIELPSEQSLKLLAPQKDKTAIIDPMKMLALDKYYDTEFKRRKDFIPAGQTTQMIVGASPESDAKILKLTEFMYNKYKLKRVYYSSYTPTNFDTSLLPYEQVPLLREHRLYQADWLLRFYGFTADEITGNDGNLSMEYDPKCAWAIRNLGLFPIEINTASPEMLLRVPGIGVKSAYRIICARKYTKLDFEDLKKLRVVLKRAVHFITCNGKFIGSKNEYNIQNLMISAEICENAEQLSIFGNSNAKISALTGEL